MEPTGLTVTRHGATGLTVAADPDEPTGGTVADDLNEPNNAYKLNIFTTYLPPNT